MSVVIGLDLGNYRSFASFVLGMNPDTRLGGRCYDLLPAQQCAGGGIPSTYFYSRQRGELVGVDAESQRARPVANRVNGLKRKMTRALQLDDRSVEVDSMIAKVVENVVTLALRELETQFHQTTNEIALPVPVNFNAAQRDHLRRIVESVVVNEKNLKVVGFISEPAAAALDYASENGGIREEQTVLVLDVGGGTTDVAVLSVYPQGRLRQNPGANGVPSRYYYDIIAQNGIEELGGFEFNDRLSRIFIQKMGETPTGAAADMLETAVENTKIELSRLEQVEPLLMDRNGEYYDFTITREEFNRACEDLMAQIVKLVRSMLAGRKVDMILLTGGASQMPMVRETIEREFPDYRDRIGFHRPSRAISYGAARYAVSEDNVQQRTIWDLGIRYRDPNKKTFYIDTMIPAGTALPFSYRNENTSTIAHTYSTTAEVYEARVASPDEYAVDRDWRSITQIRLQFGMEVPPGTRVVDELSIDGRNMLKVSSYQADRREETWTEGELVYRAVQ